MNEPRLVLEDLWVQGPDHMLVRGVSVTARAGRVTGLRGPSGIGKSLSMRAAMGVVDVLPGVDRGSLHYPGAVEGDLFEGVRGTGRRGQRRLRARTGRLRGRWVTYAPQVASNALNPGRTIGAQLHLALARRDTRPGSQVIARLLEEVGLPARAARALPSELSGGMAQRAALAVALAPEPRVLIADEPDAGLDPVLRRTVLELLAQVGQEHGVATVLITHDDEALRRIADDVVTLGPGGAT